MDEDKNTYFSRTSMKSFMRGHTFDATFIKYVI